jgi:hypothetical protein
MAGQKVKFPTGGAIGSAYPGTGGMAGVMGAFTHANDKLDAFAHIMEKGIQGGMTDSMQKRMTEISEEKLRARRFAVSQLKERVCPTCPLSLVCFSGKTQKAEWCTSCQAYDVQNLDYSVRCDGFVATSPRIVTVMKSKGQAGMFMPASSQKDTCTQCGDRATPTLFRPDAEIHIPQPADGKPRKPIIEGFLVQDDGNGSFEITIGMHKVSRRSSMSGGPSADESH